MNRSHLGKQLGFAFLLAVWLAPGACGQAGCSTSNCHGSSRIASGIEWNSSSTVWFQRDPHSQSYSRLQLQPSQQIVQRLTGSSSIEPGEYQRIISERCAGCHSNVENAVTERSLGVDCNACHGQPDKWLEQHSLESWKSLGDARFSDFGMRDTERIETRFQLCAECHVGRIRNDGMLQNVDHDLIAAGHPVLHFDFAEYLDRLPAHWNTRQDEVRNAPASDLRKWRTGRFDGLLNRLTLTRDRAAGVETIWPELSEYSCYKCHQTLAKPSGESSHESAPGLQPLNGQGVIWDDWATAEIEHAFPPQTPREQIARSKELLIRLQEFMHNRQATVRTATELIELLKACKADYAIENSDFSNLQQRLERRITEGPSQRSWESAWHWYGELRAIARSIPNQQLMQDLEKFDDSILRFSPVQADSSLRSPANFAPERIAEFQRLFEQSAKAPKR